MNKLKGIISEIQSDNGISLITIETSGTNITAIMVETANASSFLKHGDNMLVTFKETAMSIGKDISGEFSIRNRFEGEIAHIEKSRLLAKIILNFNQTQLVSVITTASAENLALHVGDYVTGLVKTTDIVLIKTSD
jgi:molybdopterin-binding protein